MGRRAGRVGEEGQGGGGGEGQGGGGGGGRGGRDKEGCDWGGGTGGEGVWKEGGFGNEKQEVWGEGTVRVGEETNCTERTETLTTILWHLIRMTNLSPRWTTL